MRLWPVEVVGDSMLPTLRPGDWLLAWRSRSARPGHIVIVARPDRPDLLVIKRVVRRDAGGWWVQGDNPAGSDDSRLFGHVPEIKGRVLLRYRPNLGLLGRAHPAGHTDH
jgi:nickel-type superoxide dismutase maturation protease